MGKLERRKELDRRRKRQRERRRGKMKVLRAQWEKRKQEKMQERIIVKKAHAEKSPPSEDQA